jgi:hypothetical protein
VIINIHAHIHATDDVDAKLEHYDHPDLVRTCLSGDNEKVKEAFTRYPDRVIGLGYLSAEASHPRLVDQYHDEGFKGLKIINLPEAYDSTTYYPIYEKAEEYKMPILFHTGHLAVRKTQKRGFTSHLKMRPGCIDAITRAFPKLYLIGAHLGNPWYEEACGVAFKHKNVYFDLCGGTVHLLPYSRFKHLFMTSKEGNLRSLEEVLDERLVSKFVFGTDGPPVPHLLEFYENLFNIFDFSQEIREKILWRNLAMMFGIEKELETK